MCGIAGFTHGDYSVDRSIIQRLTASLFHRGPNQQNTFTSPDVCLGAVRLKIIDLQGGDQPLISADNSTVIVFNGEIYNHAELRGELEGLGRRFQSHCDTEVVLQAFQQWDVDCFARLRGMFAMALWRTEEKRLILARDRIGIKPLYILHRSGQLHFGSELKAILEHPGVKRELDSEALRDYLSVNYVPSPRTLVKGIEKLAPGCFLEYRNGKSHVQPYWQLRFHPQRKLKLQDAEHQLDFLLAQAVKEHMISDVPLGIWSSGGLDSSTILHYAAEASSQTLKTFSVGFQAKCCDESKYFRNVSAHYGTDHHEIELRPDGEMASAIEDFAYYSDEPGADAGALPVWFLSRMTSRHVTVALSGDGGDELFGGYLTYLADRMAVPLRAVPPSFRKQALRFLHRGMPVSRAKIGFEYKLKRWLEGSLLKPDDAHMFWNGTFSRSQKAALFGASEPSGFRANLFDLLPSRRAVGALNRYMLLDQKYYLPDNILYKVDRMSMAHSLEVRPPFLDHRLVEFAASLPEDFKIRGFQQKFILKRVMRNKLPAAVLGRPKKGFDIPTHEWFRGFLRPLLMDTLTRDVIESTGIFDFSAIQRLIRDHMERRINAGYHLWGLLTLFLWLKKWNIETVQREESLIEFSAPVLDGMT